MMKNPLNPPSLLQKHRGDSSKLLEITGLTPAEGEGSYQPHGLSSWSSTPSPSTTWIFEIRGAGGGVLYKYSFIPAVSEGHGFVVSLAVLVHRRKSCLAQLRPDMPRGLTPLHTHRT